MTVEHIALLEMILDAVALFLGGVAIAGVLMLQGRGGRATVLNTDDQRKERFDDLLVDLVEQTERTFQKVTDALRQERESLQKTSDVSLPKQSEVVTSNVTPLADGSRRRRKRGPRRGKRKRSTENEQGADVRYSEVVELTRSGMSEREIVDKVQLPRSEIELIMELNRG